MLPDFLIDFIVLLGSFGLLINGAHHTFTSFFWNCKNLAFILFGLFVSLIDDRNIISQTLEKRDLILYGSVMFLNLLQNKEVVQM